MPKEKEKAKKTKLSPEEKEQKKLEKAQQRLRDQFEREFKFTQVSLERDRKFYPELCLKYGRERVLDEFNACFQLVVHEKDKRVHSIDVLRTHRDHAADQHLRLFECHTKLIGELIGEAFCEI
jgi:hypothetical protein